MRPYGYNSRLSTPSRSRLNTNDWYNKLYQSVYDDYNSLIKSAETRKHTDYQNTTFGNFADFANANVEEFFDKVIPKQSETVNSIPEIIVTPQSDAAEKNLIDKRRVLKEKKWLSGLKGEGLSKEDEYDLAQLDLWHALTFAEGYKTNQIPIGLNAPRTADLIATDEAERRLYLLDGAPKGYWWNSLKRFGEVGMFAPLAAFPSKKPNLIDDVITSFLRKRNEIQVLTSKGKIQRAQELMMLGLSGMEDIETMVSFRDGLKREIDQLIEKQTTQGLTELELLNLTLLQKRYADTQIQEMSALNRIDLLGTYDPLENFGNVSRWWLQFNRMLDIDSASESLDFLNRIDFSYDLGITLDLEGLKDASRAFRWARQNDNKIEQSLALERMYSILNRFNKNVNNRIKGWLDDIKHDETDIENIDKDYKVSEYYQIQDQLALNLGLFSPKKILFSSAGLLGSSMSSTEKTLLKLGSYALAFTNAPSTAKVLTAVGLNVISGGALANDENLAEVGGTFLEKDFVDALGKVGMLDRMINDGRKQLNNKNASVEDILKAFSNGEIMFSDKGVREAILNIISGANQQWAYDMNATAPGVWTDAALLLIPTSWYVSAMRLPSKYISKPMRSLFKNFELLASREARVGEAFIPEAELAAIEAIAAKKHIYDPIIIPARSLASKVANKFLESAAGRVVDLIGDKLSVISEFGKHIPTKWITKPSKEIAEKWSAPGTMAYKRAAKSFTARSIIGSSEEFWEEDVQSIREHLRRKGELGSEYKSGGYNATLLFDNIIDGVKSSLDFIFKDPSLATQEEREIWKEAKLGALGFMLQGGGPVFIRSSIGSWRQASMTNAIYQQLLTDKAENDAAIKKGILFAARSTSFDDYNRAMLAFDDISRYNKKKNKIAEEANDSENAGFADEAIDENRILYNRIFNIYNDPITRKIIEDAGFKYGSDEYNIAIALTERQGELLTDATKKFKESEDIINRLASLLKANVHFQTYMDERGIKFTPNSKKIIPEGKLGGQKKKAIEEKYNREVELEKENWTSLQKQQYDDFIDGIVYLASIGSLIDQINTYSQLEAATGKLSNFLKYLKDELAKINKERTDLGYISLNTEEEVLEYVKDNDMYQTFKDLFRKRDGFLLDVYTYLSTLDRILSKERITKGRETEHVYPIRKLVELYKNNLASDQLLQLTIEDDFFNIIKRREEIDEYIENANIGITNDLYLGFDGETYVVQQKVDDRGLIVYEKYKYNPHTYSPEGAALPFDKEEYYYSKKADEHDAERELSDTTISDEQRVELGELRMKRERMQQERQDAWNEQDELDKEYEMRRRTKEQLKRQELSRIDRDIDLYRQMIYGEEENDYSLQEPKQTQKLEEPLVQKSRVLLLIEDGYSIERRVSKRKGTPIYYAKKGRSKVRLSQQEYDEYIEQKIQTDRVANLRSSSFYEYDPKLSVHVVNHLFNRDNAFANVEAIILNAVYNADENLFNDLLEYFRLVLTDEQIEDFRLVWLNIHNYVNTERESMKNLEEQRRLHKEKYAVFNLVCSSITSIVNTLADAFQLKTQIEQSNRGIAEKSVEEYIKKYNPKTRALIKSQLLDTKIGISKASYTIALVKDGYLIFGSGGKYTAVSPSGNIYKLTKAQYDFIKFIKSYLKPIQLEFTFDDPSPEPTFDMFETFFKALGIYKLESGRYSRLGLPLYEERPWLVVDEKTILDGINNIPVRYKRGIGSFGTRISRQDLIVDEIKKNVVGVNPNILPYTTPLHYFINKNGKIVPHLRVHAFNSRTKVGKIIVPNILDPEYESFDRIKSTLESLFSEETVEDFKNKLLEFANERNRSLGEYFGFNSVEYEKNTISIEGYKKLDFDVMPTPSELASLLAYDPNWKISRFGAEYQNSTPKSWFRRGLIIDEIIRDLISNHLVVNRPEYRMSDDVFKLLCDSIIYHTSALQRLGFKLIADEILVRGKLNGIDVAGVTDMIAVSKNGDIYLIDFKTTSGLKLYLKDTYSVGAINRESLSPTEAKLVRSEGKYDVEFDRSFLKDYKLQLGAYNELFRQTFDGIEIKESYIAPIYSKVEYGYLNETKSASILSAITSAEPFRHFKISIDNSLFNSDNDEINWSEVNQKLDNIVSSFDKTKRAVESKLLMLHGDLLFLYNNLRDRINNIQKVVEDKKAGKIVPDSALYSELDAIITDIQNFNHRASEFYNKTPIPGVPPSHTTRVSRFNPQRRQPTGELYKYNNIDRRHFNPNWPKWKRIAWERVSALPDFILNSEWELNVPSYLSTNGTLLNGTRSIKSPNVNFVIRYTEHTRDGNIVNHVFDGMLLLVATEINGTPITNQRAQNPLLMKIDSILFDRNDDGSITEKQNARNIQIVFTKKSRINGIEDFSEDGSVKNISEVFLIQDVDIEKLITGEYENGFVGVGAGGSVCYINAAGQKEREIIYPLAEGREVRNGMLYYVMKLPYLEDGDNKVHTPVISLTPAALTENDIDFIIDILRNYGSYKNKSFKVSINGTEYESPMSVDDILYRTLLRFHSSRFTDNDFVFDFLKVGENKYDYTKVVGTLWVTGEMQTFDLRSEAGLNALKLYLLDGANVWYENEDLLTRGLTSVRDSRNNNLFLGVELFFKDYPEINQIKYSDHLVFDRKDFDPNEDGSFAGINGFHWMVRHGWILSDFIGIKDPLMSTDDVELIQSFEDPVKPQSKPTQQQPTQQDDAPVVSSPTTSSIFTDKDVEDMLKYAEQLDLSQAAEASESNFDAIFGDNKKVRLKEYKTQLNKELALKRIQHVLGKSFPVRFVPSIIERLSGGYSVVGRLTKTGILLSEYAENDVEFHEAFHGVIEILLPDAMRIKLYDHFKKNYLNDANVERATIAEGLADLYYEFKQSSPEIKLTWNIYKLFKNIYTYAKSLALLNDIKIAALFAATDAGIFRLFKASPDKFILYEKRYKNGLNYTIKDKDGRSHNLKTIGNRRQIDDIIDVLVYKFITESGIDLLGKNLLKLDTRLGAILTTLLAKPDEIKRMQDEHLLLLGKYSNEEAWDHVSHSKSYKLLTLEGVSDKKIAKLLLSVGKDGKPILSPLAVRNAKMFREVFDHWNLFRPLLENKIESLGVDKKYERDLMNAEDADGGDAHNQEEFGRYDQPFYEHSMREDVPTKIRFFLSTIPDRRFADANDVLAGRVASVYKIVNGEKERMFLDSKINSMGYTVYMPYSKVYNTLLRMCHNARSIEDLDNLMESLGSSDYMMQRIHKAYHRFRKLMYIRWTADDFDNKQYKGVPKVMIRNTDNVLKTVKSGNMVVLHPSEYISEEFPNVVRYSHDIVQNEKTIHKAGDIIENAIIMTDPDYEQLVVQLYQSVHAQRVNFLHTYVTSEIGPDGRYTGRYSYQNLSTDLSYSTQIYPRLWFNSLRSGYGGIFSISEDDGNLYINTDESGNVVLRFGNAARLLRLIKLALSVKDGVDAKVNRNRVPIRGMFKSLYNDDEFSEIQVEFVRLLNSVGIQIDMSTLNYMLLLKYPTLTLKDAFVSIFTSTDVDSITPLIEQGGILDRLQIALNNKNTEPFFIDRASVKATSDLEQDLLASGFRIYSENGFLLDLAKWSGLYRLASKEAMQIGPNNTKLYTYAQHHSASEDVVKLNHVYDDNGNLLQEGLIADLKKSPYVVSADGKSGSIIVKLVLDKSFNLRHDRIKLATSSGIKLNMLNNGGTKYSEITSREDWLSKASILQEGNIIFPTLSDKSTWFYLIGFVLPGIDYNKIKGTYLPKFSNTDYSRIFFNRDSFDTKSKQQLYYDENPVLDQLIEYAYRELDLVNQTINDLGLQNQNRTDNPISNLQKVENFHTGTINGARFAFITGVYGKYTERKDGLGNVVDFELDESVDDFYEFNVYDKNNPEQSVLISRERAMRVFFDKKIGETDQQLRARLRSMIANMLLHRVNDLLKNLVKNGIIKKVPAEQSKTYLDSKGNRVYSKKVSDFFGYKNVYLDHKAIDSLVEIYKTMPVANTTYENYYTPQQIESAAIIAYVYDVTAKSIMSKEETLRIFTGFPHFFKWKFEDGHLVDIMTDESKRHGGEGSTGTSNVPDLPNIKKTYRVAEIDDYEIESPIIKSLRRVFRDNLYRDVLILLKRKDLVLSGNTFSNLIVGENIYSKGSSFAKLLTNVGNDVSFSYKGKVYKNSEHAYQTWKSGEFDELTYNDFAKNRHGTRSVDTKSNFSTMVHIITQKLYLNQSLIDGIDERGGLLYLAKSWHTVPGKQDYYFLSKGQNRFIAALAIAYNNAKLYELYDNDYLYTEEDAENILYGLSKALLNLSLYIKQSLDVKLDKTYDDVYNMPIFEVEKQLSAYENGKFKRMADDMVAAEINSFRKSKSEDLDGINVTDGTAYITDKMAENLLRMRGAWNSEIEEAFKLLRGNKKNKYLSNTHAYISIVNALLTPLKYSAYGYRMQGNLPVHYYNKYALFPIFKGISYGFTAELYKKMNDPVNGVDMLLMKSSVKVGNQAVTQLYPEMTEELLRNFSFAGHIYEEEYSSVRRQLNTNPHERENMMLGTQAAKIALLALDDNQTYKLRNGEFIRGRYLKQALMSAIKKLSKIGVDKVNDTFFKNITRDENGNILNKEFDNEKFANFVEKELSNRNADKNILDAVRDVAETGKPVLNAVSNMQWIESILVSYINKNVIDINLPGNALYQRTIFGMEGIQSDENYPLLAAGRTLKMINEEGSMDAVVSIDFFYHIIPAEFRYDFEKAKQWLIDNNIISGIKSWETEWHNATANIMAYRIPTLAVSSIHALRIVDVLPIVRDTVVLPKEFTAITGSDFDIDKLYMSMIKYKVTKFTYKNIMGDYKNKQQRTEYEASSTFDEKTETESFYQNQILDFYLALLKTSGNKLKSLDEDELMQLGKYAHILHRPIDNDTKLVKNVLKRIESSSKSHPVEPFVSGSLYTQSELKSSLATAKFGIGPLALNNTNHILTRMYNVSFKSSEDSILTLLNADSLHEQYDRDGKSIYAWISALINAHVDVAKDPYILRLNVNKFTYNLISLLIRTGFGKDAFYFINQPIIKELASEYQNLNGDVVEDPMLSAYERWMLYEEKFMETFDFVTGSTNSMVSKLSKSNQKLSADLFKDASVVFKALFGIKDNKYEYDSKTLLERLITDESLLIDKEKGFVVDNYITDNVIEIDGNYYSPKELQGYVYVANKLFEPYAKALSDLVQSTKIDTKKHGISYLEQQEYKKKYNNLKKYHKYLFDEHLLEMLEDSFIDYKTTGAIDLLPEILKPQMIHFTDGFENILEKIQGLVGNKSIDAKKAIQNQLLAYSKQKAMNMVMEQSGIQFNDLVHGRNSLINRIESFKNKILSDTTGLYSHYASNGVITNMILSNIHPVPYIPEFGQTQYQLIQLDCDVEDDPDYENGFIDSWEQMWQSDDVEIKTLARDLAIYAFMTSADTRGMSKFFKYVPYLLRKDIGYVDYLNNIYDLYNNQLMQFDSNGNNMDVISVNEFFRNSWRNNNIVPIFKPKDDKLVGHKILYDDINKTNGLQIKRNSYQIFFANTFNKKNEYGLYAPYIKMRRPNVSLKDADPYLLYKLVYVGTLFRKEVPIYALSEAKGVSIRTGTDVYEIYEFDRNDQNGHVVSGKRLDNIDWEQTAEKMYFEVGRWLLTNPLHNEDAVITQAIKSRKGGPKLMDIVSTNKEGQQTISSMYPHGYDSVLRAMYDRLAEIFLTKDIKYSDKFKKYCKGI